MELQKKAKRMSMMGKKKGLPKLSMMAKKSAPTLSSEASAETQATADSVEEESVATETELETDQKNELEASTEEGVGQKMKVQTMSEALADEEAAAETTEATE